MMSKLLEQMEPLKLNESTPELLEGYRAEASTLHWEEHLP